MQRLPLFAAGSDVRRLSLVRLSSEIARSTASLGRVAVEGEVVVPKAHPGGTYFTLRDRAAQVAVRCPAARLARCRVVAGERVLVTGSVAWLPERGQLQLVAEEVAPVGEGAIAAAISERRARLHADGLLARPRRRLPRLPAMIGVVCGTEAAVRGDIESVVAARFPGYPMAWMTTNVSGPGAADAIAHALVSLDSRPEVEIIVLARGGGDAGQLLPFSDEALCRAICASSTPVVSAVGHEGDWPLCDEVADLRCGTPSLAAAAVVPSRVELEAELDRLSLQRRAVAERRCEMAAARFDRIDWREAARRRCEQERTRLASASRHLEALSPVRVLERGYAVVRAEDGTVLRNSSHVPAGSRVEIELAKGRLVARVEEAGT